MARMAECDSSDKPFHPGKNFSFPKRKFGSRNRSCQSKWFENFPFLHYNVEKDALFCHFCMKAVEQKKILKSKRPDYAFVSCDTQ